MSIELELRLEGQDANEDTLLDLKDWLERSDIEGLIIRRKQLPPVGGQMGFGFDNLIIIVAPIQSLDLIIKAWRNWRKLRTENRVSVNPKLIKSDNPDITKKIEQKLG